MATESADDIRSETRWALLATLALGTFAAGTDNFLIAGVLSGVADDLRVSVSTAGQFVTGYSIAYAVGAPIAMTVTRIRSPRRLLIIAMTLFVAVDIVAALAQDAVVMAVARLAAGCLAGIYSPTAAAVAAATFPAHLKGRALAAILGGSSLATLCGVPVGVWIAAHSSWRTAFAFVAALATIALAGIVFSLPETAPTAPIAWRDRLAPLRRGAVLVALAVTVASMAAGFLIYTYIQPLFAAHAALGSRAVGPLLIVQGAGALLGLLFGSSLVDRFGARPVLLAALTVFALDMALLSVAADNLVTMAAFMVVWGATGWAFVPAQQHSLIADAPMEMSAILLTLNGSAMHFGIALGSATGGLAVAAFGAGHLWVFATAFAAVALALTLLRPATSAPIPVHRPAMTDYAPRGGRHR